MGTKSRGVGAVHLGTYNSVRYSWAMDVIPAFMVGIGVAGMCVVSNIGSAQGSHAIQVPSATSSVPTQEPKARKAGTSKVTLNVKDRTVKFVVDEITRQANLQPVYNTSDPLWSRRITVRLEKVDVMEALAQALKGTGLIAKIAPDGETVMIRPDAERAPGTVRQHEGMVTGRVTDSATGKPISGVTVTLAGSKKTAVTNDQGSFTLREVPLGDQTITVRIFGYRSVTRSVTVVQDKPNRIVIALVTTPTTLSGVVTTATGVQRKIEVGNDITTLNVDSIMRRMPVTSVSDLLANRVPGMDVALTSGSPGAPSKIRIRGLSSINSTNDPILVVDGVRVYAAQGNTGKAVVTPGLDALKGGGVDRSTNMVATNREFSTSYADQLVPSILDQIDPNSIATIDVLKGPSAVALYGTDAANGMIVITTKRGEAGPVRWNTSMSFGTESMPGKWPTNYFMWGHSSTLTDSSGIPRQCQVVEIARGFCIPDSLYQYQILNDPHTTIYGRGNSQIYRVGVRGGNGTLTYSLTGTANHKLGLLKIPDADLEATVRRAERLLQQQRETPEAEFSPRYTEPFKEPMLWFDRTYQLQSAERAEIFRTLMQPAEKAGMLAAGYIEVSAHGRAVFKEGEQELYFPFTRAQYSVTVRDPNGTASGWAGVDWNDWQRIDAESISSIALDKCLRSRNAVAVEPGRYTTVLEPQAVADLVTPLMRYIGRRSAEEIEQSPFNLQRNYSKIGLQIIDERITIEADPTDPDLGFPPYTMGGAAFNPVKWIENGVLKELAYERDPYGIQKLGRNYGLPNSGAFRMSGGTASVEAMIANTKRGILVTRFSNIAVIDMQSLLMTGVTRDGLWLIENGKVSKPIKNFRFTESSLVALNNVLELGVPQRVFHPGAPIITPSLRIQDFSFTAMTDAV